mmetsp:Transcript_25353/g.28322  ORF Transcript_25353/g.28322 Transcript_25353/m.28322 type:complete len:278 (+) Transcript_25353:27-860(+)
MRSFSQNWLLVFFYLTVFDATIVVIVDSFLHYHSKKGTRLTALFHRQQQRNARRWNRNFKKKSNKLSDVSKSQKLTLNLTANGVTKTLKKQRMETLQHVLTKAVIWKLFMNDYPNLEIEYDIGDDDYLPDVVSISTTGEEISFWGEAGRCKVNKALDLMLRYPNAHIVHCRWGIDIETFMEPFTEYLRTESKTGRLNDLLAWKGKFSFATLPSTVWQFIDEDTGTILIERNDLEFKELDLPGLLNTTSSTFSREVDSANFDGIGLEELDSSRTISSQ